ncbi:11977_t:CDS:1 [Funneliformis geosporum]|uniref:18402_t:CDS:1 n=1 Tax=Funneliformis geosporum TaxID=1117311 RepID=A0A9W4SN50_9GLOM|nr:18402_t:CDS:1 [Funneliformis geosporum]CAI2182293.1 11977_t:CDS:1 [Funneliformis geosporum]
MLKHFILVTLFLTLNLAWLAQSTPAQNYLEHCSGAITKESTKNVVSFSKPSHQNVVIIKGSEEIDYSLSEPSIQYSPSKSSFQKLETDKESTDGIVFSLSGPKVRDCEYCGGFDKFECAHECYIRGYKYYACGECYCHCSN